MKKVAVLFIFTVCIPVVIAGFITHAVITGFNAGMTMFADLFD